jgi:hypothetical protein
MPRIAEEGVGQTRVDATIEHPRCYAFEQTLVSIFEQADNEGHARITRRPSPMLA